MPGRASRRSRPGCRCSARSRWGGRRARRGRWWGGGGGVGGGAGRADLRLGIDFSYRFVEGARRIRELVAAGELGRVYAARLVFHNAYGPDKEWFYDRARSGGGCVIDLGTHLIDLLLWIL